ncbi:MAG: hypothetical protein KME15_05170 [Drouetiella hepatica Uher 2000/2452]|uniref:Uncharacterized protein n=1 Tax=Drouetiella hepatica Uher 2000/2452 TaxID=904376 RepID=A0A951ULG0_9CYAN|nr:hypothetical protein [Drouetiella hepatica Uher 2000/2452]
MRPLIKLDGKFRRDRLHRANSHLLTYMHLSLLALSQRVSGALRAPHSVRDMSCSTPPDLKRIAS